MGWPVGESSIEGLPSYFADFPRVARRERRPSPRNRLVVPAPPSAGPRLLDRQFFRVVDVPLVASIVALSERRQVSAQGGRMLGPPAGDIGAGPAVAPAEMRRGFGPVLLMELELGPWLSAGTRIDLRPARQVRVSRRYFRSGHALLDAVVARIEARARPGAGSGCDTVSAAPDARHAAPACQGPTMGA